MKPSQALAAIKKLRDQINDTLGDWTGPVLDRLDSAADQIEFPSEVMKPLLEAAEKE